MQSALNAQINAEMWSAYLYLSMSMAAADKGLKGVANWFAIQFKEEQDHATRSMLTWFVDEQVEEEDSAREIIDQLRMIDCNKLGLYMIDKEMAARVYSTPSPLVKE